ncbi:MAG: ribonuclease H-like domain-containing protein [Spirochaetia bacterium]
MAKLSGRLQQLRAMRAAELSNTSESSSSAEEQTDVPLPWKGWTQLAPYVWRRGERRHYPEGSRWIEGVLIKERSLLPDMVFYDFETTGLSGGAGTVLFLAGFGRFEGEYLHIDQLLLADYPGEPEFIREIVSYLSDRKLYVSYNGKGFDRHILLNRLRLHGYRLADMPRQLDLLYPTRKIWGQVLERCNLGSIEAQVLGIGRESDIPGALIPECYQDFLRTRNYECMQRVVAHHLQDIESLARLLFHIERLAAQPGLLTDSAARTGIGQILLSRGDMRGITVLEDELLHGNERAGRALVLHYKRMRALPELRSALAGMLAIRPGYFQVVETAKLLEHADKNPKGALELLEPLLGRRAALTGTQYKQLLYRRRRLEKKLGAE